MEKASEKPELGDSSSFVLLTTLSAVALVSIGSGDWLPIFVSRTIEWVLDVRKRSEQGRFLQDLKDMWLGV